MGRYFDDCIIRLEMFIRKVSNNFNTNKLKATLHTPINGEISENTSSSDLLKDKTLSSDTKSFGIAHWISDCKLLEKTAHLKYKKCCSIVPSNHHTF